MRKGSHFAEILDEYLGALEAGNAPDREALLARHPDLAEELQAALLGIDFVHSAAPRLAPEEPTDAEPGRSLGDYRLLRELGRGGMAVVYEAEQVSLGRRVALKVLPFAAVLDPKQLQRFKNEAMAAAHLRHPNIVPVYGVGCERGVHYYAMQFVEGQSLATAIRDLKGGGTGEGPRTPISSHGSNREPAYIRMAAALGVQAAEALDHAHQLGIVHRDVKPGNLLVDQAGTLWVTDFGLASSVADVGLTVTGELLGTIRYMSPEQALAKRVPVDHRTDVYSLGATLYELFTLEPAFPGDDPHLVIQDIAFKEPVLPRRLNPALPRDLETVLLKAMWKDPGGRYATAQEMADDLTRFLENRPIEAKRPGLLRRAAKWGRRHRTLVGATVALLLLSTFGLATGTALLWREQEQTKEAFKSAQANLNLALEALDQIYIDEAEGHPKVRGGLSKDLLEKGLGFYEKFAKENPHNKVVVREMGHAQLRAGQIFRELGHEDRAKEALDRAISAFREAIRLMPDLAAMHSNLGHALHARGDLDGAIASYREAIRLKPEFAEAHSSLGYALVDKGDHDGAIASYREAVRLKPELAGAHVNLANALNAKGDHDGAIASAREAIRLKPELAEAHCNLGNALSGRGDHEGAIASFREAIRLKPDLAVAHYNLGNSLSRKGDPDGAIASFREAIRLQPDYANAHNNLGNALDAKGDHDGEIASYREAIRLEPELASAHYNLGNALSRKGDPDGAIASYREAIRLQPDYASAHINLGNALSGRGDHDGEIASYREAIRLEPELASAHNNLGNALLGKGDPDGAIASCREAIRLEPELAEAHFNLGNALLDKGDPDGAIASFREAVRLKPELAGAHSCLGYALHERGDLAGAIASYREAIRLKPDDATAHYNLGTALRDKGDPDGAIRELGEAIRLKPDDAEAHCNLGCALNAKGDHDGAIASYREAIRLKPGDATAHYNLGLALRDKDDPDGAIASCREAIRLQPDYANAHYNLGNALSGRGDPDSAIASYREAIRLKPELAGAHRGLGYALLDKGDLDGAIASCREAIRLKPGDATAHYNLGLALTRQAELLYAKSRHAESARMYAEAFAEDGARAEDIAKGHRYNAACSAALAAAPGGADAAEWRGRALEWLRADLAAREKAASGLVATLEHWKEDPDFASVRDRLGDLPEPEREAWRGLWAAVDLALKAARPAAK